MLQRSDIDLVIPSKQRASRCAALMRTMLTGADCCVAESELADYEAAGIPRARIRTHANLSGLPAIRNHLVQASQRPVVVQIDHDLLCVWARVGHTERKIVDPALIMEVIYGTAVIASDIGVSLFGWGRLGAMLCGHKPAAYKDSDPFSFTSPFGGAVGAVGKLARWDNRILGGGGDPDAIMNELLLRRIIYADLRYYFDIGRVNAGAGGLQSMRSAERCTQSKMIMKAKWGTTSCLTRLSQARTVGCGSSADKTGPSRGMC